MQGPGTRTMTWSCLAATAATKPKPMRGDLPRPLHVAVGAALRPLPVAQPPRGVPAPVLAGGAPLAVQLPHPEAALPPLHQPQRSRHRRGHHGSHLRLRGLPAGLRRTPPAAVTLAAPREPPGAPAQGQASRRSSQQRGSLRRLSRCKATQTRTLGQSLDGQRRAGGRRGSPRHTGCPRWGRVAGGRGHGQGQGRSPRWARARGGWLRWEAPSSRHCGPC